MYKMGFVLIVTVIFMMFSISVNGNLGCYSTESCIYNKLMTGYNSQVRPASFDGSVDVKLNINLKNILGLDEKNEVLFSVLSITASWTDKFLTWNSTEYKGVHSILISVKHLWVPDFAVVNSADKIYDTVTLNDFKALLTSSGNITWLFGRIYKTSCTLDISMYPFDTQSCTIVVENYAYTENMVNLTEAMFVTASFSGNGLWNLESKSVTRETYYMPPNNTPYPRLTFTLILKRKSAYYVFNIILPSVFVLMAAMGVFWLPPGCGEKVSLSITVLLAFSVFQIVITSSTPVNSDQTPLISKLMMSVMGLATMSLLTAMLTVYFHHKGSSRRVPKWLRCIMFKYLAKVYSARNEVSFYIDNAELDKERLDHGQQTPQLKNKKTSLEMITLSQTDLKNVNQNQSANKSAFNDSFKNEIINILNEIRLITDTIKEQKKDDLITDEWKLLAKIVDRILFTIAVLILIIVTIVMV